MALDGIDDERLRREVKTQGDDPLLDECVSVTRHLLLELVADVAEDVPDEIFYAAHLAAAVDMFNRRKAPNGVLMQQFGGGEAAPLRLSNDPLRGARALLEPWVLPGFA